jgi:hypothetical protein
VEYMKNPWKDKGEKTTQRILKNQSIHEKAISLEFKKIKLKCDIISPSSDWQKFEMMIQRDDQGGRR